jgi:hypothetical protein
VGRIKKRKKERGSGLASENSPPGLEGKEYPFYFQNLLQIINYFEFKSNFKFE